MPKKNNLTIKARHVKTVVAALANFGLSAPAIAEITGLTNSAINNAIETSGDSPPRKAADVMRLWKKMSAADMKVADFAEALYRSVGKGVQG